MSHQRSQRSLPLAPHEQGQLKLLVQAHRTHSLSLGVRNSSKPLRSIRTAESWETLSLVMPCSQLLHYHAIAGPVVPLAGG